MKYDKDKSTLTPGDYFLTGNEACAEGALATGCRFYAGYPISPSSEIMELLAKRLPEVNGVFIQMEDEIGSIAAVIGASWAGAKAMTATSGPGVSLMQENIGYAVMTETPCVIVDVQRAGPSTGQATRPAHGDLMQVRYGSQGDYQIIAIVPWSVQEMYDETINAFNLAETYRVPVFIMADAAIAHLRENCRIPAEICISDRVKRPAHPPFGFIADTAEDIDRKETGSDYVPPMPSFGDGEALLITGSTHDEWGFRKTQDSEIQKRLTNRLNDKILKNSNKIIQTEKYSCEDAETLIIAYGITARAALSAIEQAREEGFKVGLLRLKTIWPFPEPVYMNIDEAILNARRIIVPEMNKGQIAREIQRIAQKEVVSLSKVNGEIIYPEEILESIKMHHPL